MAPALDPSFATLPARALADAALEAASRGGASHADLRLERIRSQSLRLHDARLESTSDDTDTGIAVRVVLDGTWGFAADAEVSTDAAVRAARRALAVTTRLPMTRHARTRAGSASTTTSTHHQPAPGGGRVGGPDPPN